MSKSTLITIGQILEMTPGDRQNATWINDEFEAVVSDVKRGTGKAPSTAVLTDPHNSGIAILGNFFGTEPSRFGGKVCHFSGKGMTRTEYKGTQQVTIGEKATIQIVGDAKPGSAGKAGGSGSSGGAGSSSSVIHGATVGMAMNQACENIRLTMQGLAPEAVDAYYAGTEFSKDLWTQASDIIRIARVLEAGKLADAPKVRNEDPQDKAKREAEEKAAAEKAEAERKAKEEQAKKEANQSTPGTGNVDEDVPF
jgi:hypothetical protein